jgi:hypothetical protein
MTIAFQNAHGTPKNRMSIVLVPPSHQFDMPAKDAQAGKDKGDGYATTIQLAC